MATSPSKPLEPEVREVVRGPLETGRYVLRPDGVLECYPDARARGPGLSVPGALALVFWGLLVYRVVRNAMHEGTGDR